MNKVDENYDDRLPSELLELTDEQKQQLEAEFLAKRYLNATLHPTLEAKIQKALENADLDDLDIEIDLSDLD